jgi:hypothetical protein
MTSVFRLKANHPNTKVILEGSNSIDKFGRFVTRGPDVKALSRLLDHTNPLWLNWVRWGIITQIRIDKSSHQSVSIRIVVKYRCLEEWMSVGSCFNPKHSPLARLMILGLGLDWKGLTVDFGIQY